MHKDISSYSLGLSGVSNLSDTLSLSLYTENQYLL